jgi:hypothetical protein
MMLDTVPQPRPFAKILTQVLVLLAGVVLLYGAYWFTLAQGFKSTFENWLKEREASGYVAKVGSITLSGFPATIALNIEDLTLGGREDEGAAWSWAVERAHFESRPWQPHIYRLGFNGRHDLKLLIDGEAFDYIGTTGLMRVEATLGFDGLPTRASAKVEKAVLKPINTAPPFSIAALALSFDTELKDEAELGVSLEIEDFKGPNLAGSPFGGDYRRVVIHAKQLGKLAYRAPFFSSIAQWRDQGGTIEFSRLGVDHGPVLMTAEGTVSLDKSMQPLAAFTTRTQGFFEAVNGLQDLGLVAVGDGTLAKIVLSVLSKPSRNGGRPYLDMPISVKGGRFFAGPVPLLRIRPLNWAFLGTIDTALNP